MNRDRLAGTQGRYDTVEGGLEGCEVCRYPEVRDRQRDRMDTELFAALGFCREVELNLFFGRQHRNENPDAIVVFQRAELVDQPIATSRPTRN